MSPEKPHIRPLSPADWRRALPWLLLLELLYLVPYCSRPGGVAGKYIWDEHCVDHTYPVAWLAREEVRDGLFPLWNPHSGAGLPLLANTLDEAAVPHALLKYLLPFPLGLEAFIALKLLIALTGAFALGRRLGGSRQAAILAAVLYSFTGFIALNVNSVIGTVFVLPWCVFALHLLAERPRLMPWLLVAAAFALSLLGGNPQIPFQALCLGYALYLFMLVVRRQPLSLGRWLLLPASAVVAGAMVALPQLLPFVQYLKLAFSHHLPGFGLLHLDPRGLIGIGGPHWDPAIVIMVSHQIGSMAEHLVASRFPPASWADANIPLAFEHLGFGAVFFLALALLRLRRLRPEASFFAAAGLANIGLAFGIFPFSLLALVPPFNQVSNWRFTTFMAAICVAALAAMVFDQLVATGGRLWRRPATWAMTATAAFALAGAALVASQAGLPLTSPILTLPLAATLVALAIIKWSVISRRGALIIAACFLELFAWDRIADRPLFVHPFDALRQPENWADCLKPDPQSRFIAYGDVLDPSLGMLSGRDDLRSYEMIFPDDQVRWYMAINRWSRLEAVEWYMSHYYFAPEPENLSLPEVARAGLSTVMAPDPLPPSPFAGKFFEAANVLAPGPEFVRGAPDREVFLHAPSSVRVPAAPPVIRMSGSAGVNAAAWDRPGDGVTLQLIGGAPARLLYSRYLDPHARPDERRRADFTAPGFTAPLAVSSLPGPRDDRRSDFGFIADLHDPAPRAEFERTWEASVCGDNHCYRRRETLPRLRVAESAMKVSTLDECLELVRNHHAAQADLIVQEEGFTVGEGRVDEADFGTNAVTARVSMKNDGMLILADTYYPGWKAEVDDVEVPIHRANCVFRAVQAPAGGHEVRWTFRPESFRIGLWVGMASLLSLVGTFFRRDI